MAIVEPSFRLLLILAGCGTFVVQTFQVRVRGKAEAAGLKPDDVILSINGRSTSGLRDVDVICLIQQSRESLCLELDRSVRQSLTQ